MRAMIFAAGLGTRLRPLTDNKPKALVEVVGTPAIAHVIDSLVGHGIDDFVINLHHYPDQIRQYIADTYPHLNIEFSDESEQLLDTGGALVAAKDMLSRDDIFIVHNADIITNVPISEMITQHITTGADVTLLVSERYSSRQLIFDASGKLRGWINHTNNKQLPETADFSGCVARSFNGVHVISSRILKELTEFGSGSFSIIPFYAQYARKLNIRLFQPEGEWYWFDIGNINKLEIANKYLTTKHNINR